MKENPSTPGNQGATQLPTDHFAGVKRGCFALACFFAVVMLSGLVVALFNPQPEAQVIDDEHPSVAMPFSFVCFVQVLGFVAAFIGYRWSRRLFPRNKRVA
ncbi:MAG: hypothetical protein ACREHD_04775 [Pirellulales bacterium]